MDALPRIVYHSWLVSSTIHILRYGAALTFEFRLVEFYDGLLAVCIWVWLQRGADRFACVNSSEWLVYSEIVLVFLSWILNYPHKFLRNTIYRIQIWTILVEITKFKQIIT